MHALHASPHLQRGPRPAAGAQRAASRRGRLQLYCTAAGSTKPVAVISGASTGIGKCIAQRLEREGWDVFAGVRSLEDGPAVQLGHSSIQPILLDVTSAESVAAASLLVTEQVGKRGVQALINNAGKVVLAPLEFMPVEVFEDQLQVNLTGALRVTQAFLPLLRAGQQPGRIINMSSQSGTVSFPLFGAYSASKFGLEALSDCLRYELYEQGIKVVLIKPGPIKTNIWGKGVQASTQLEAKMPPEAIQLYGPLIKKITQAARTAEEKSSGPEQVATVVLEALTVEQPEARYMIGRSATVQMILRRFLPDGAWDRIVTSMLFK